jgi:hypothetical protein
MTDARSLVLLTLDPLALVLADARSLAILSSAPLALVLADSVIDPPHSLYSLLMRWCSICFLAFAPLELVGARVCLSPSCFLALVWPLSHCTNMRRQAAKKKSMRRFGANNVTITCKRPAEMMMRTRAYSAPALVLLMAIYVQGNIEVHLPYNLHDYACTYVRIVWHVITCSDRGKRKIRDENARLHTNICRHLPVWMRRIYIRTRRYQSHG